MDTKLMIIRHTSTTQTYRRAGLCIYQESSPYEVTEEQIAVLRNDPRIVMHEVETVTK